MRRLIKGDELQVQKEFFGETSIDKVLQLERIEGFEIEGVLEVFKLKVGVLAEFSLGYSWQSYGQSEL